MSFLQCIILTFSCTDWGDCFLSVPSEFTTYNHSDIWQNITCAIGKTQALSLNKQQKQITYTCNSETL
jgi:hypothetical protein